MNKSGEQKKAKEDFSFAFFTIPLLFMLIF